MNTIEVNPIAVEGTFNHRLQEKENNKVKRNTIGIKTLIIAAFSKPIPKTAPRSNRLLLHYLIKAQLSW